MMRKNSLDSSEADRQGNRPRSKTLWLLALSIVVATTALSSHFTYLAPAAEANAANVGTIAVDGVSGGGYQSTVLLTSNGQTVYTGGDVSGVHKSVNSGAWFRTKNTGFKSVKIATLEATPDNEQILYAGTGDKGSSGGLYRSTDAGATWQLTAAGAEAQFAGNHASTQDPLPVGHPRSNGDLIAVISGGNPASHTDDVVIAGTYKHGVKVFTEGGDNLVGEVRTNGFVRGIAADPRGNGIVYAAIYFGNSAQNGIYQINVSNPNNVTSSLSYQTSNPEEVVVLGNGHVYVAVGPNGIVKKVGSNWTQVNSGLTRNSNYQWAAVTGFVSNGSDVVYATVNNSTRSASHSSVWRTVNGGNSWSPLVNTSNVSLNIYDGTAAGGPSWWFKDEFGAAILGNKNTSISDIEVIEGSSRATDLVVLAGRGGLWRSENGGGTWSPAVGNMLVTANNAIAYNPNDRSQIAVANTDFRVLESNNNLSDIDADKPEGSSSKSYDIMFDPAADEVIVATGSRDSNSNGEVFIKPAADLDGTSSVSWTSLNLTSSAGGNIPQSVAVGYPNPSSRVILAAVKNSGVWRYANGSWAPTSGDPDLAKGGSASLRSNIVWPDPTSSTVYLLDAADGLYRSNDAGSTWTNMWPGLELKNNDFFHTNYMTSNDSDVLYLSVQGDGGPLGGSFRLLRIDNASTGTISGMQDADVTDMTPGPVTKVGPIDIDESGRLFLVVPPNGNTTYAGFWRFDDPGTSIAATDQTTSLFRSTIAKATGLEVDAVSGFAYISQQGTGALRITVDPVDPVDPALCLGRPATIVGTNGNDTIVGTNGVDVILGLGGDDDIRGLGGNDLICGGGGNDRVRGGNGSDRIAGGSGNDVVFGDGGSDTVFGGDGWDSVRGGQGADALHGGDGKDRLLGGGGEDQLFGDLGHDDLFGGSNNDLLEGGPGQDGLYGNLGNDTLKGQAHKDTLGGGSGNDKLFGGGGPDTLAGGPGNDIHNGGLGVDTCASYPAGAACEQ
jgi:Ca2+-binding RTX toxin-like protein